MAEKEKGLKVSLEKLIAIIDWLIKGIIAMPIIIGLILIIAKSLWGLSFIGFSVLFFAACQRMLKASPPEIGLITIWGRRTSKFKKEGLILIAPFFPFYYDVIPINVEKKNKDLPPQICMTPKDLAKSKVPLSYTYTPDKDHLTEYINYGGSKGVENVLDDIIEEKVREWTMAEDEGPQTFEQLMKSKTEAVNILLKAIAGQELVPAINCDIPTSILLKYFDKPQKTPTEDEVKVWGKDWINVANALKNEDPDKGRQYSEKEKAQIKKDVAARKEMIKQIRSGNGAQKIPQLGITLNRLNIGDIALEQGSELAKSVERIAKEQRDREAGIIKLKNVRDRVKELTNEKLTSKGGLSINDAIEVVQTERGIVNKTVHEIKGFNLEGFAKAIGETIGHIILKKGGGE